MIKVSVLVALMLSFLLGCASAYLIDRMLLIRELQRELERQERGCCSPHIHSRGDDGKEESNEEWEEWPEHPRAPIRS